MSIALAIHGGAGAVSAERLEANRGDYEEALDQALQAGRGILSAGGNAVDAVTEAVATLEDSPMFNAGKGSVLSRDGGAEMSASIMQGELLLAGAVGAVRRLRNPIRAARALLSHRHTAMVGGAAEQWLIDTYGLEAEEPDYFIVPGRKSQWERLQADQTISVDHDTQTVGAVARDADGKLAAATSTGGLANQLPGRLSDSAVPGSGTWADERTIAVSATGDGDVFLRHGFARRVADLVELEGVSLDRASHTALAELAYLGGEGGCIALTHRGAPVMKMSSRGMFRGLLAEDGHGYVSVLRDEPLHRAGKGLESVRG
ncbi:MAG: isoaspartyl peptidase/L-asparaginase [Myxococcota bacterium]